VYLSGGATTTDSLFAAILASFKAGGALLVLLDVLHDFNNVISGGGLNCDSLFNESDDDVVTLAASSSSIEDIITVRYIRHSTPKRDTFEWRRGKMEQYSTTTS
jgi:hypothetical protein